MSGSYIDSSAIRDSGQARQCAPATASTPHPGRTQRSFPRVLRHRDARGRCSRGHDGSALTRLTLRRSAAPCLPNAGAGPLLPCGARIGGSLLLLELSQLAPPRILFGLCGVRILRVAKPKVKPVDVSLVDL